MHFEIHKEGRVRLTSLHNGGGDWRWELLASDGQLIAGGEGYASKAICRDAIETLKRIDKDTPVINRA